MRWKEKPCVLSVMKLTGGMKHSPQDTEFACHSDFAQPAFFLPRCDEPRPASSAPGAHLSLTSASNAANSAASFEKSDSVCTPRLVSAQISSKSSIVNGGGGSGGGYGSLSGC